MPRDEPNETLDKVTITSAADQVNSEVEEALSKKESGDLPRISKVKYDEMVLDPLTDPVLLGAYSQLISGESGFEVLLRPDPDLVLMSETDVALEDAMGFANNFDRRQRFTKFKKRLQQTDMPVIIAEGDSWFQFPRVIADVIDHLSTGYNVLCLSAAGDTAGNMVAGPRAYGGREFLSKILQYRDRVEAFLFSGAGNDIIGTDEATGKPALDALLQKPAGALEPGHYINRDELERRLEGPEGLKNRYTNVINSIRAHPDLATLPIVFHAYDVVHPFNGNGDTRRPIWTWLRPGTHKRLAKSFELHGIEGQELRREVIRELLKELRSMLQDLAGPDSTTSQIWVAGDLNTLTSIDEWADEIHPTSKGFFKIAQKFNETIEDARNAAAQSPIG